MRWNRSRLTLVVVAAAGILAGCASSGEQIGGAGARVPGAMSTLGNGTVHSFAEFDASGAPRVLGIAFSAQALDGLPASGSDQHHCVDRNRDGIVDAATECLAQYELVLPLPDAVARRADIPFKWVLLNWNPHGHIPPGVYDVPHFDVHFFMESIANAFAIQSGPCGPEFVRCDQFETARKPVPVNYMHPDFKDVQGVVPAMGNHLIDLTGPEFNKQPFTRTWIYGVYGGKVTFYEEMVTRSFLLSKPSTCFPIKAPAAVEVTGFYPTVSCLRHDARTAEYTVSMERFVMRQAEPPAPR
jgi:hypothetical protein